MKVYNQSGDYLGDATVSFTTPKGAFLTLRTDYPLVGGHGQIAGGHPIREEVASLSTSGGDTYYRTKGDFTDTLGTILAQYGLLAECMIQPNFPEDEGRATINLYYQGHELNTILVVHWYRMPSGRYEFTCYLS